MSNSLPNPDGGDTSLTPMSGKSAKKEKLSREERNLERERAKEERKAATAAKKASANLNKTKNKSKDSSNKPRGSSAASLPQNRREIPLSSFDLLNGDFKRSNRNKKSMTILGMFFLVAAAGLTGLGYLSLQEANSIRSEIVALTDEKERAVEEFGVLTGLSVSETELFQRSDSLTRGVIRSTVTQPDVGGLVDDLNFVATPSVQLNSVIISAPSFVALTEEEGKEILEPAQVAITVSGASLNDIITWAESLRGSEILDNFQFARRGETVTVTANFVNGHISGNDIAVLSRFGINSTAIRGVTEGPQEIVASSDEGENSGSSSDTAEQPTSEGAE